MTLVIWQADVKRRHGQVQRNVFHLQLDHPAVENTFVSGGSTVGLQHVAGVSDPVLQLLQALGEELVLRDDSVNT